MLSQSSSADCSGQGLVSCFKLSLSLRTSNRFRFVVLLFKHTVPIAEVMSSN